jgi:hypothetical protein
LVNCQPDGGERPITELANHLIPVLFEQITKVHRMETAREIVFGIFTWCSDGLKAD